MTYKILNNSLYSCDTWGNIKMKISENVVFGTYDDTTSSFLVTKGDGKVEIRDKNGNIKRLVASDGVEARFGSPNEIVVRKRDGRTCVVDWWGNVKRCI